MSNEETFGQRVKERRRELGLTQDELARRVGCAPVTIRKIEYDDLRPSVQIAERLAMALNILLEERAAFVRLARVERVPEPPTPTPAPALEEIGAEDLTGRAIRGYALGERIGSGGMGAVYRAVQPLVEREVAVKIILPQYANHPEFIRRFEVEAQLVARLEHPHVVPLYDYWREPSVAFLVMRLLRGGSLRGLIESGPLPIEMAIRMLEQVGSALAAAHRAGVIHRDLKPANILLDEDHNAYLADFGIAKNLGNPNLEDVTQVDAIVGSPAYISPEQIRSEFVRPQTDIYALGVVLYELLTGHLPFSGPTPIEIMHQHLSAPLPPLAARRAGLPGALDDVIERATAKDPLARYPDVDSLLADLHRALGGVETTGRVVSTAVLELPPLTAADNPYKGLRAFGEGDAADFFGREALTQQLLIRLGEGGDLSRFLAVVGPSGSGKSSVVKAGLIPALRRGGLPGSDQWFIVELMPGAHPLEELETALLRVAVNPPESLLTQLREDKRGLVRAVRRCLPDDPNVELVLVIDQFEEVFTLAQDEATRAHLLDSLVAAVLDDRSRLRVIVTLRADFTDRPLNYVDFGELLRQRNEFVLPLTPDELEHAIVGPAERVGLQLETGLVAAIMRDVGDQPGALPLLQYALTELFEKREGRTLAKAAYDSIGGVLGALGRRAEEVFAGLDEAGQETARQLFLRLVTLGEGTEDTRRRVLRAELMSVDGQRMAFGIAASRVADTPARGHPLHPIENPLPMENVIDSFGKHRLLSFDRDPLTRGPTVEVAHEALLREWPRLREWLNESRADVRLQRQLATAASEWQNANRDASFLLTGARLEQFEGWAANTSVALTQDERAFLTASLAERDRSEAEERERQRRELEAARKLAETEKARAEEQTRSANRLRLRNRVITAVGGIAIVLAVLAGIFGLQSNQNATRAETNLSAAQAASTQAFENANAAEAARDNALNAQATAEAERLRAENEKQTALSRELAAAAISNLDDDPERSILLALQAESTAHTVEAENALHRSLLASRVRLVLHHDAQVWSVTYSPDGKRIATASQDKTAKIWDAKTGQLLLTLTGHTDSVNGIVYSPDGKRIATTSDDHTAKVWNASTGELLLTFSGHTDWVTRIAFSPDGARLVTTSGDMAVIVWDADTGEELLTFSGHENQFFDVAFNPDGKRIATSDQGGFVRVWDVISGKELLTLPVEGGTDVRGVAFSPDGTRVAMASDGIYAVKMWDAATGEVLLSSNLGHTDFPVDIAFSPNGKLAATGGGDEPNARVWNTVTGEVLYTLSGHTSGVAGVAFSPDGTRLATASWDNTARVWDITPVEEALFIPRDLQAEDPAGDWTFDVRYSPDGTQILTDYPEENAAKLWDAISGKELLTLGGHADFLDYSPDGKMVAGSSDNTIVVWDAKTGKQLVTLVGHTDFIRSIDFSADGNRLASASWDGTVRIWDLVSGKALLTLREPELYFFSVAYSPDGKRLVAGDGFGLGIVWDATTGEKLFTLSFDGLTIFGAAYSPDGKRLALANRFGTIRIWDAVTGNELLTLRGNISRVNAVTFSPDGKLLATASDDGTARVWDATTGVNLLTLPVDTSAGDVSFSPDGKRLAVGAMPGVYVFVLPTDELVALARSRLTRELTTEECQQYLHMEQCPTEP